MVLICQVPTVHFIHCFFTEHHLDMFMAIVIIRWYHIRRCNLRRGCWEKVISDLRPVINSQHRKSSLRKCLFCYVLATRGENVLRPCIKTSQCSYWRHYSFHLEHELSLFSATEIIHVFFYCVTKWMLCLCVCVHWVHRDWKKEHSSRRQTGWFHECECVCVFGRDQNRHLLCVCQKVNNVFFSLWRRIIGKRSVPPWTRVKWFSVLYVCVCVPLYLLSLWQPINFWHFDSKDVLAGTHFIKGSVLPNY